MTQTDKAPPIVPGKAYRPLQITVTGEGGVLFPDGVKLRAQVRTNEPRRLVAELTTENGGLRRVSDDTVELQLTPEQTDKARAGSVILDLVRTDTAPEIYLYVEMTIPVLLHPVTR